jgi:hypothetical protein
MAFSPDAEEPDAGGSRSGAMLHYLDEFHAVCMYVDANVNTKYWVLL